MPAPVTQEQIAASESAVPQSETPTAVETTESATPVATDTTETVAETDEQKNERVVAEEAAKEEKKLRGFAKRSAELTAEKYAERQRAENAERRADELQRALLDRVAPKQP